ncbi:MAG: N-acetyltransferase [Bacteroidetes bacterium]|nr:N-acetyltransferase [Bacteroidota bacterium]
MDYFVHPSAIVDDGCQIGAGSKIWHFCHLMPNSQLGERCILGQNVFVASGVKLGNGVKVQNNVSLYTGITCEDDVFLGPSAVFTNVINPRSFVERKTEFRNTLLKTGCSVGANATIICGVTLGAFCLIGAGAVVTKNVPDFALVVGNPARQIGWVSRYGHRLHFEDDGLAICPESGVVYELSHQKVQERS